MISTVMAIISMMALYEATLDVFGIKWDWEMGYKIGFFSVSILFAILISTAVYIGGWNSKSFWDEANKLGILFTLAGTIFTVATFFYVGLVGKQLKRRHRIPESHDDLKLLLTDIRSGLRDWSYKKDDVVDLFHQARAHLENVSEKLDGSDKAKALKLAASISREGWVFVFRRSITEDDGWKIQRNLSRFVTLLSAIHRDNEVEKL